MDSCRRVLFQEVFLRAGSWFQPSDSVFLNPVIFPPPRPPPSIHTRTFPRRTLIPRGEGRALSKTAFTSIAASRNVLPVVPDQVTLNIWEPAAGARRRRFS